MSSNCKHRAITAEDILAALEGFAEGADNSDYIDDIMENRKQVVIDGCIDLTIIAHAINEATRLQ
jgi:hypothetical protein